MKGKHRSSGDYYFITARCFVEKAFEKARETVVGLRGKETFEDCQQQKLGLSGVFLSMEDMKKQRPSMPWHKSSPAPFCPIGQIQPSCHSLRKYGEYFYFSS